MLFVGLVAISFFVFNYFPFLFFSSIGWLCGAGVFRLIGCQSPSPGLALPIFFNNNNNNNNSEGLNLSFMKTNMFSSVVEKCVLNLHMRVTLA